MPTHTSLGLFHPPKLLLVLPFAFLTATCSAIVSAPTVKPPAFHPSPSPTLPPTPVPSDTPEPTKTPTPLVLGPQSAANARLVATINTAPIDALAWSSNGAYLAASSSYYSSSASDYVNNISQLESASLAEVWSRVQPASDLIFDASGRLIVADGTFGAGPTIVEATTGASMGQLYDQEGGCHMPFTLGLPEAGNPLFTASMAPTLGNDIAWVCTWDFMGDHRATKLQSQDGELKSFSVSPDGTLYALGIVNARDYPFYTTQLRLVRPNGLRCALPGSLSLFSP